MRLLVDPNFRRAYLAGGINQVGDAFQFVALMWFAVATGGPLGLSSPTSSGRPS
jgi:hypothetical protein